MDIPCYCTRLPNCGAFSEVNVGMIEVILGAIITITLFILQAKDKYYFVIQLLVDTELGCDWGNLVMIQDVI